MTMSATTMTDASLDEDASASTRAHAVECSALSKRFGDVVAVDGVEFHVRAGEAYGLLGPNGAGKTTTIAMLLGLLRPDRGTVRVFGRDVAKDPLGARAMIGYVPQEVALYPELTARENLRFFGRLYGLPRRALRVRIDEVLELVGLADRAGDLVRTYSGGMQRRVNIAAALLHEPSLLVLDEPTVGVDAQSRNAILASIEVLVADGISVLYTSHYMEEVERICQRVGIVDHGRIVAEGTTRELIAQVGQAGQVDLALVGDADAAAARLREVDGVVEAARTERGVRLVTKHGQYLLPVLLAALDGVATVTGVEVTEPDLEAVFLHLTGTSLRD
jgi:ABC-2 type transport system ATP-binding protein